MEDFQNSAVEKLFEPGSIFKPITMSAAINENTVAPDTVFDDKLGYAQFGTYKVYNYTDKDWGKVTMTQVLQEFYQYRRNVRRKNDGRRQIL